MIAKISVRAACVMLLLGAHAACAPSATTQQMPGVGPGGQNNAQPVGRQGSNAADPPDVLLEVPRLSVEQITLEVDNVEAHLSLNAQVANLVSLQAGADVLIGNVMLEITGVQAEAYLEVRLDNVTAIIERTLQTIDSNPELLQGLLRSVDNAVNTVGGVANTALQPGGVLSQTVNTLGQTVQRTLDTTGNIVERTLDTTGNVVSSRAVGSLLDSTLQFVSETTNAAGQTVRRVRDSSGSLIEYTLNSAGAITQSRVVQGATGGVLGNPARQGNQNQPR